MAASLPTNDICDRCRQADIHLWIVSECKHRICSNCLSDRVDITDCRYCRTEKFFECVKESKGCEVEIRREKVDRLEHHLKVCEYRVFSCPYECPVKMHKSELIKHISEDCPRRVIECAHCKNNFFAMEMEDHLAVCGEYFTECRFCFCGLRRKETADHLKVCARVVRDCELSSLGCGFKGTFASVQDHLTLRTHGELFAKFAEKFERRFERLSSELEGLKKEVRTLKEDKQVSENQIRILEEENKSLKDRLATLEEENRIGESDMTSFMERAKEENLMCTDITNHGPLFTCFSMLSENIEVLKQIQEFARTRECPNFSELEFYKARWFSCRLDVTKLELMQNVTTQPLSWLSSETFLVTDNSVSEEEDKVRLKIRFKFILVPNDKAYIYAEFSRVKMKKLAVHLNLSQRIYEDDVVVQSILNLQKHSPLLCGSITEEKLKELSAAGLFHVRIECW